MLHNQLEREKKGTPQNLQTLVGARVSIKKVKKGLFHLGGGGAGGCLRGPLRALVA